MQPESFTIEIPAAVDGMRLDKALSLAVQDMDDICLLGLSRSRLQSLIETGAVMCDNCVVTNIRTRAKTDQSYTVRIPEPVKAKPEPEDIHLDVVFEDEHLVVVNKPVGMVVHPAPGASAGTLVNALLYHCHNNLSGIGGERRPGIVHRIDKDTSGLLVVAKSDFVHQGLSTQFAAHTVKRQYTAFVWRKPDHADPRLKGFPSLTSEDHVWWRYETYLDRHRTDRTRMCVSKSTGRHAVTYFSIEKTFMDGRATKLTCQLETGRTHQIRVHMSHLGFPLIGDQTYGRHIKMPVKIPNSDTVMSLKRQALHARTLGFQHPVTQETMFFEIELPGDLRQLENALEGTRPLEFQRKNTT